MIQRCGCPTCNEGRVSQGSSWLTCSNCVPVGVYPGWTPGVGISPSQGPLYSHVHVCLFKEEEQIRSAKFSIGQTVRVIPGIGSRSDPFLVGKFGQVKRILGKTAPLDEEAEAQSSRLYELVVGDKSVLLREDQMEPR